MKVEYSIDQDRRLILTRATGIVKFADINSHQDRLLADPDFVETFDQLIDTSEAEAIEISVMEAIVLARRSIVSPQSRRAFVATQPHIYGLGRLMEIYHGPRALVKVFDSMGEAMAWVSRKENEEL